MMTPAKVSVINRMRAMIASWIHPNRFYGQHSPPLDQVIYQRYFFTRQTVGVFVECGAYDGMCESTCLMFERHLRWRGFNIEALPQHFSKLQFHRPESTNVNVALSDASADAVFTQAVHPKLGSQFGNGSLRHSDSHRSELETMGCIFEKVVVQTQTWNSFCDEHAISHVDLLVPDVEGHESAVISGMTQESLLPLIAVVEAWPEKVDLVKSQMEALGYIFDGIYESNLFFRHLNFKF